MLDLLRRLVTCFEVHKDLGLPSDVSTEVLRWLRDLLHELFVIIPPATRSRFEADDRTQPQQPGQPQRRYVGGNQPRKRKTVATSSRGHPSALKKPCLRHEPGHSEAKHLVEGKPTEGSRGIAEEAIEEGCAAGPSNSSRDRPNPQALPSPREEEVDLSARGEPPGSWESPPVATVDPAPCGVMIPVAQEADALPRARQDSEGETPSSLASWANSVNEDTAEEEGELLVDPAEKQEGEAWEGPKKNGDVVEVAVMEPILSSGPPEEATGGELHNMAPTLCENMRAEESPFAKGKELLPRNREEDAEGGQAPKTDGNTAHVPLNRPNRSAPSSPPGVIQATTTLPHPADERAMPESEKPGAQGTANPVGKRDSSTQLTSQRNNATSVRVSLPTKPGTHIAKKVSLITPSPAGMPTYSHNIQRQGHGKPLTSEYLFGRPFSQLRRLAEQRGVDVGGEKEQLVKRLLTTEE